MPRKIVSPLQRRYELPCAYLHNRHVAVAEGEEQPVKVVLILLPTSHQCHLASERDLEARRDGLHDLPLAARINTPMLLLHFPRARQSASSIEPSALELRGCERVAPSLRHAGKNGPFSSPVTSLTPMIAFLPNFQARQLEA